MRYLLRVFVVTLLASLVLFGAGNAFAGKDYVRIARESLLRGDAGKGEAIDNFRYHLKEHPSDISVRWELINVYLSWNWYDEVHEELQEIEQISKNSMLAGYSKKIAETYKKIAPVAFNKDETKKGVLFTKLSEKYFPATSDEWMVSFFEKGKKALADGKKEKALKCFNTTKALNRGFVLEIRNAYYEKAYQLVKEEKYATAFYYFNMGDSFYHKKDAESMAVGNTLLAKAKHLEMTDLVNNEPLIHNFYKIASVLTENVPAYEVSYKIVSGDKIGKVHPKTTSPWYSFPDEKFKFGVGVSSKNGKMIAYVDVGNEIKEVKVYEGQSLNDIVATRIYRVKFQCIDNNKYAVYRINYDKI